ncbi:uncharacterized protein LOC122263333 [Penaeus japonicus]|uniref:uncharacterized protein LOC122263333 n=1 Tax=Penaeus japonicus TaxID=27405 RepID=UPI001C712B5E|nr:uncharacterized protein LOC122263333 [Penaeus japonicus]
MDEDLRKTLDELNANISWIKLRIEEVTQELADCIMNATNLHRALNLTMVLKDMVEKLHEFLLRIETFQNRSRGRDATSLTEFFLPRSNSGLELGNCAREGVSMLTALRNMSFAMKQMTRSPDKLQVQDDIICVATQVANSFTTVRNYIV